MSSYGELTLAPARRDTYVYSTGLFQPGLTAGVLAQIAGSSTKKLGILKVYLNYSMYSDTTVHSFEVKKTTSLSTGGTSAAGSIAKLDSGNNSPTGSILYFTSPGALGGSPGRLSNIITGIQNAGGGANGSSYGGGSQSLTNPFLLFDADKYGQAAVLNGNTEALVVEMIGNITPAAAGVPQMSVNIVVHEYD